MDALGSAGPCFLHVQKEIQVFCVTIISSR